MDIGCGIGAYSELLAQYAPGRFEYVGADYAAEVQAELERVLTHLVEVGIAETGIPDVIITGGVGLNCTFNGKLARSGIVRPHRPADMARALFN